MFTSEKSPQVMLQVTGQYSPYTTVVGYSCVIDFCFSPTRVDKFCPAPHQKSCIKRSPPPIRRSQFDTFDPDFNPAHVINPLAGLKLHTPFYRIIPNSHAPPLIKMPPNVWRRPKLKKNYQNGRKILNNCPNCNPKPLLAQNLSICVI